MASIKVFGVMSLPPCHDVRQGLEPAGLGDAKTASDHDRAEQQELLASVADPGYANQEITKTGFDARA
ncbi:MAG: hypothetical protein ABFS45_23645 [Pseudomonadota bacterium]